MPELKANILIIEDEKSILNLLTQMLTLEGFHVFAIENMKDAFRILNSEQINIVLTDVRLPDGDGITITAKIKKDFPDTEVIVLTAYANVKDAVKAMKLGAFDYLTKGDDDDKIVFVVNRAFEKAMLTRKIKVLEDKLKVSARFENITGKSHLLLESINLAKKVALTDTTVLLFGETGTGKELFARAIPDAGNRRSKPLITVNCAAIPRELQESEFFGHKKGSFTGAIADKKGVFEEAHTGTLFLDEIGEMSIDLQAKLLRAIENKIIYRIGDNTPIEVDVRIIAATNRDLYLESQKGNFRVDLLYRINSFSIELPPLRKRKEDIKLLAMEFIQNFEERTGKKIHSINSSFWDKLLLYDYPGNIRELKGIIERAIILSEDNILSGELLPDILFQSVKNDYSNLSINELEKFHIIKILQQTSNNKNETARILGIGLTTLYRKIKEYNIE